MKTRRIPPVALWIANAETGEIIGSLQEGAMELLTAHIPAPDDEVYQRSLQYSVDLLNSYGVTAITDAWVMQPHLNAYRALDQRNELTLRVVGSLVVGTGPRAWSRSRPSRKCARNTRAAT